MIDVEQDVYNRVDTRVTKDCPGVTSYNDEPANVDAVFPCYTIVEKDNSIYSQTSSDPENHVSVMYEVNVFSNKQSGKKAECKKIMEIIDDEMLQIGFTRTMMGPVTNLENPTICRRTARYKAVIDKDKLFYWR